MYITSSPKNCRQFDLATPFKHAKKLMIAKMPRVQMTIDVSKICQVSNQSAILEALRPAEAIQLGTDAQTSHVVTSFSSLHAAGHASYKIHVPEELSWAI